MADNGTRRVTINFLCGGEVLLYKDTTSGRRAVDRVGAKSICRSKLMITGDRFAVEVLASVEEWVV